MSPIRAWRREDLPALIPPATITSWFESMARLMLERLKSVESLPQEKFMLSSSRVFDETLLTSSIYLSTSSTLKNFSILVIAF